MQGAFTKSRTNVMEERTWKFRLKGAGAAAMTFAFPTKEQGAALAQVGTGDHKITFKENPGNYVGVSGWSLQSATMTDLKNFSVIFKDYDATNWAVEFTIFNSSGTATDLSTAQSLGLTISFAMSNLQTS